MMCQNCGQNKADSIFEIYINGEMRRVHVCRECVEKYRQYSQELSHRSGESGGGRALGESPFPPSASVEIKRQRQLNSLHGRLREAVAKEQYELAAKIRDEIAAMEKDVTYHD